MSYHKIPQGSEWHGTRRRTVRVLHEDVAVRDHHCPALLEDQQGCWYGGSCHFKDKEHCLFYQKTISQQKFQEQLAQDRADEMQGRIRVASGQGV